MEEDSKEEDVSDALVRGPCVIDEVNCHQFQEDQATLNDGLESNQKAHFPTFRKFRTAATFIAFFGDGIPLGLLGTCLVDLSIYIGVGIKEISTIFIWRFAGNVVGNAISGYLFDKYDHHLLLWIVQIVGGAILCISPWWPNLLLFSVLMFVLGITHGALGTGVNSCVIRMWRERSAPFTFCLFISVMIGGSVTSQMVKPFLASSPHNNNCSLSLSNMVNNISDGIIMDSQAAEFTNSSYINKNGAVLCSPNLDQHINIHWPFVMCGCLAFLLSIANLVAFILTGHNVKQRTIKESMGHKPNEHAPANTLKAMLPTWILFFCLTFLIGGLEQSYGGLISAFVVRLLGWSTSKAANMTSLVYGCLALGRVAGALSSPFVKPSRTMAFVTFWLLISNIVITSTVEKHHLVVWICTAIIATSLAPCIPLSITWGRCVLGMSAKCPAVLLSGYNAGRMSTPVLVSYLFDQFGSFWFLCSGLTHSILIVIVFILLLIRTR